MFGNLPWTVMGAGILVGGVPTIFHYFNARNGPFVIAWYATIVLVWILAGGWLFVGQGAEFLARHPGLLNPRLTRPWMIRVVFVLSVLGGAMAMTAMVLGDFEVPTLP